MKTCSKCKQEKAFEFFHKHRSSSDGYKNICKACRKGEHVDRYVKNKEEHNKRAIKWRKDNPEKVKEIQKTFREKHKESRASYAKAWREANRGSVNSYNAYRHSCKKQRTPSWLSEFDLLKIQCLYQVASMRSKESGYKWHVDHIVPLQGENVCGLHVPWNLRVIPAEDNLRKYNKYEI